MPKTYILSMIFIMIGARKHKFWVDLHAHGESNTLYLAVLASEAWASCPLVFCLMSQFRGAVRIGNRWCEPTKPKTEPTCPVPFVPVAGVTWRGGTISTYQIVPASRWAGVTSESPLLFLRLSTRLSLLVGRAGSQTAAAAVLRHYRNSNRDQNLSFSLIMVVGESWGRWKLFQFQVAN